MDLTLTKGTILALKTVLAAGGEPSQEKPAGAVSLLWDKTRLHLFEVLEIGDKTRNCYNKWNIGI